MLIDATAALCLALWVCLIGARGGFWLAAERDQDRPAPPPVWPPVTAVIPARNEADVIRASVTSLLQQDYPGALSIIVVDDDCSDETAALARQAGASAPDGRAVTVVTNHGLPAGWTGKLWAVSRGVAAAEAAAQPPELLLLTDADIAHAPDTLSWLVAQSRQRGTVLTSLMAKLRCTSLAERMLVPAFIFFFQMLYPFRWVGRPRARTAAAAGGCMLVDAEALRAIGGIESLRNDLIDDCALARRLKRVGPIWLGLTERVRSLRPYPHFADIRRMVSRSAYAQLRYSPLAACRHRARHGPDLPGAAAAGAVAAGGAARWMGLAACLAMALAFQPVLRFYRRSPLWGLALPVIALLYTLVHAAFRLSARAPTRRPMEGTRPCRRAEPAMTDSAELRSGKGHTRRELSGRLAADPAAAPPGDPGLLRFRAHRRRHRRPCDADPAEKLARLDALEASLLGQNDAEPEGVRAARRPAARAGCRRSTRRTCCSAFRQDVTKLRYADWDELIDYCRYSAMPVGRFVLDVHGESRATWPANDALCAALQIINHLQDCADDYRNLDRVYVPLDALADAGARRRGARRSQGDRRRSPPACAACRPHRGAAGAKPGTVSAQVADARLAMEISVIQDSGRTTDRGPARCTTP